MQTAAVPIELGLTYLRCQSVGGSLEVVSLALDFAPIHQLMCFPSAMRDSVQSHCQFSAIASSVPLTLNNQLFSNQTSSSDIFGCGNVKRVHERRLKYLDSFRDVE